VVALDGKRGELADKFSVHGPRVGSYRVNVESFERVALPSLEMEEGRILIIDEIGKMECFSETFVRRVREIFHTAQLAAMLSGANEGLSVQHLEGRCPKLSEFKRN